MSIELVAWIPWIALITSAVCAILAATELKKWAGWACVGGLGVCTLVWLLTFGQQETGGNIVRFAPWIRTAAFNGDFSYLLDGLSMTMLGVVTGIGLLVTIYAVGYMKGDTGFARFFAAVGLFIFAMTTVVMADNLVLLFMGWEVVGLASYLLIGHDYQRPAAVAAASKAFIVNRVGDFGFLLGLFCLFQAFGTVELDPMIKAARALIEGVPADGLAESAMAAYTHAQTQGSIFLTLAPFGLMLGAFGKSAQIPLYIWLPDAMEGPTPVSALIHAATMVTSGVYLIARTIPIFELSPYALPTVAVVGTLTALLGATIACLQTDIKKVFAYSTVSQLGYMFLGVAALSTVGGIFHLISHAFFKALLFLTAGSVMHQLAGQLDLRYISGLRHKMPYTFVLMGIGCASLAAFPFVTAGFWSKDLILGDALAFGLHGPHGGFGGVYIACVVAATFGAFLTAYYAFRVWFRVFFGDEQIELGDHAYPGTDPHGRGIEDVGPVMNGPLVVLAVGALTVGLLLGPLTHGVQEAVSRSTANPVALPIGSDAGHHGPLDPHETMMAVSTAVAFAAIFLAWLLHAQERGRADSMRASSGWVGRVISAKFYVDEVYHALLVVPMRTVANLFYVIDAVVVDGLVRGLGWGPRALGESLRPAQSGKLQGYGLGMVLGLAVVAVVAFFALT